MFTILNFNEYQIFGQSALDFDGVDDCVVTNYYGISGQSPRTIEAWIKTTTNANPSTSGSQNVIVDYGNFVTGGRLTFNVLYSNAIRLEVGGSGLSGSIAVNDGLWHHVAVVYNPNATNQLSLYVDGVLDNSGNKSTTINTSISSTMTIGKRIDNVKFFNGTIDEVRVYNIAKTLPQIIADTNRELCNTPSNLVSYWKLNEGIPNGNNTSALNTYGSVGNQSGTLYGFALTGTSSNWVDGKNLLGANLDSITVSQCSTYLSPAGHSYSTTGVYTDTLTNINGCDSLITINLTIGASFSTITKTACKNYISPSGKIYSTSGIYIDTLLNGNSQGCDSIITINLTIDTINTNLNVLNETITAMESGATFQWLNCDNNFSIIAGETDSGFSANQNGNYAVEITKNNCVDTLIVCLLTQQILASLKPYHIRLGLILCSIN